MKRTPYTILCILCGNEIKDIKDIGITLEHTPIYPQKLETHFKHLFSHIDYIHHNYTMQNVSIVVFTYNIH